MSKEKKNNTTLNSLNFNQLNEIYDKSKGINIVNMKKEIPNTKFNLNMLNNSNTQDNLTLTNRFTYNNKVCSSDEKELCIFLYTLFQFYLEKAVKLISNKDIKNKIKSKKLLEFLIENSFINYIKNNKIIYTIINGILNFYLATCNQSINQQIYDENLDFKSFNFKDITNDCIELPSESLYLASINFFNSLPDIVKIRYVNYYQEIYNNLGIIYFNNDEANKGLEYFCKAEQIYNMFSEIKNNNKTTYLFDEFLNSCSPDLNNKEDKESNIDELDELNNKYNNNINSYLKFNFFVDGGIDNDLLEKNFTQTLFYFAQSYTRLNFKKKGVYYCCQTLKRQIDSKSFIINLKDSVINCINLSDFFLENQNFAQAEYLLLSALSLLPDEEDNKNSIKKAKGKKRKLRAQVQIQLGKCYLERLKFSKYQVKEQIFISENNELNETINKRVCMFSSINVTWPKITDIKNKQDATYLFRLSNTQLTRSLKYFVLDGYVTEHVNISRLISELYKNLVYFEDNYQRVNLMIERRMSILEPIIKSINKQAYLIQWQELTLELAEINAEYYEKNYDMLRNNGSFKSINTFINYGLESIKYYNELFDFIMEEINKLNEEEKSAEDFTTAITIKLSAGRLYGKLVPYNNIKLHQEYLIKSLDCYKETKSLLLIYKDKFFDKVPSLKEQLSICEEMISLLPVKINQLFK